MKKDVSGYEMQPLWECGCKDICANTCYQTCGRNCDDTCKGQCGDDVGVRARVIDNQGSNLFK